MGFWASFFVQSLNQLYLDISSDIVSALLPLKSPHVLDGRELYAV
jgi:hypothetical protein